MDSWVCPKCGKRFSKQQSLAGHMGHHNGVARSDYVTREELERRIDELKSLMDHVHQYMYDKIDDLESMLEILIEDRMAK